MSSRPQEPKSWTKPAFAAATGGCTVELSTNAAGETEVLQPTIVVPGPVSFRFRFVEPFLALRLPASACLRPDGNDC